MESIILHDTCSVMSTFRFFTANSETFFKGSRSSFVCSNPSFRINNDDIIEMICTYSCSPQTSDTNDNVEQLVTSRFLSGLIYLPSTTYYGRAFDSLMGARDSSVWKIIQSCCQLDIFLPGLSIV